MIEIPLRLGGGLNDRMHWRTRQRQWKAEKNAVGMCLNGRAMPIIPCAVRITRIAPSSGLDDDNLAGACKATRDAIAAWLGIDDKKREIVRYEYAQQRGPWSVRIEFLPAPNVPHPFPTGDTR